jgi:hypothetical protein
MCPIKACRGQAADPRLQDDKYSMPQRGGWMQIPYATAYTWASHPNLKPPSASRLVTSSVCHA